MTDSSQTLRGGEWVDYTLKLVGTDVEVAQAKLSHTQCWGGQGKVTAFRCGEGAAAAACYRRAWPPMEGPRQKAPTMFWPR
jgi:hypothetical protein